MQPASLFAQISEFLNQPSLIAAITQNRFFLILFILILSYLKHSTYKNIYLTALINIPGTILHELAHFVIGLLLYAKPTGFSLFPKKSGEYYITGSVGFRNITFYNALPASLAPLLLLIIGYYFDKYFFHNIAVSFENYILFIVLQTIIIENSLPSATDFKVGFGNITGIIFYTFLLITACFWIIFA